MTGLDMKQMSTTFPVKYFTPAPANIFTNENNDNHNRYLNFRFSSKIQNIIKEYNIFSTNWPTGF